MLLKQGFALVGDHNANRLRQNARDKRRLAFRDFAVVLNLEPRVRLNANLFALVNLKRVATLWEIPCLDRASRQKQRAKSSKAFLAFMTITSSMPSRG